MRVWLGRSVNFWLGVCLGSLVILVLGWRYYLIAHFVGGLVAGIVARRRLGRGAFAGFLAGIFGGVVLALMNISLGTVAAGTFFEFLGWLFGAVISAFVWFVITVVAIVFGAFVAMLGGLLGGALTRYM
jgi:uncharacterized membrane protein YeaQ/YmgE (transglycosylase-associated protein family)